MTQKEVLQKYKMDEQQLSRLMDTVIAFLEHRGISVEYISLEKAIENEVYKIDRATQDGDQHHETCISDGMQIWLHNDIEDVGGVTGRLYDLLHVGCGHVWQWSAPASGKLKFYGEKAWTIGSNSYVGRKHELDLVRAYELEAGEIAISNLKKMLNENGFDAAFSTEVKRFYTDYLNTDLDYIVAYYKTGKVKNFFANWRFNSPVLREVAVDYPLTITRRTNRCIALISAR